MQQTFITSYGKAILENGILYIRKTKPSLTFHQVVTNVFPVLIIIRLTVYFFEDNTPKRNVGLVIFGLLSLFYGTELGYRLYKAVFKQSFANRIALQKIHSWRLEEDTNDLEMHLYLQLVSGKERKLTFRKCEKYYDELITVLSQYIGSPNFASRFQQNTY